MILGKGCCTSLLSCHVDDVDDIGKERGGGDIVIAGVDDVGKRTLY